MQTVYISIGSNLGDRVKNCINAIDNISRLTELSAVSSFYETEPVGNEEQPLFINCAVGTNTDLSPHTLLYKLLEIENKLGRVRDEKWGQRRALSSDAGVNKTRGQRRALSSDAGVNKTRGQRRALSSDAGVNKTWGPRTIDLDIIFYGQEIIDEGDLQIPHPEAHKRRFVLEPLSEIAPEFIHPVFKISIKELLKNTEDTHGVVKLD